MHPVKGCSFIVLQFTKNQKATDNLKNANRFSSWGGVSILNLCSLAAYKEKGMCGYWTVPGVID